MAKRMRRKGKSGTWFTNYRDKNNIDPKTGWGKKVEISLGTTDERLAERELGRLDARIEDGGGDPNLLGKRFSEVARQFIKKIVPTYSGTTQKSVLSRINRDLVPHFGNMRISDIGVSQVIDYKFMREGKGKNGKSIEVELSNLKSIMNLARPDFKLPSRKDQRMRYVHTTDPIVRYFNSEEEFQSVLGFCPEWLKPIVTIARKTGLRRENILGMQWSWVNLFARTITVPGRKHKNKKLHLVPMNQVVYDLFKGMKIEGDMVFPPHGRFKDRAWGTWTNEVYESFKRACRQGGRPEFRFHDLRHDFCSQLVMAGKSILEVRDLAGHSSVKMTELYAHLAPSQLHEAIKALDNPPVGITGERKVKGLE